VNTKLVVREKKESCCKESGIKRREKRSDDVAGNEIAIADPRPSLNPQYLSPLQAQGVLILFSRYPYVSPLASNFFHANPAVM